MTRWIGSVLHTKPEGSLWPSFLVGIFVSIGGILFGYDTASISGIIAMDFWIKEMSTTVNGQGEPVVTSGQTSLVVSILSAGTFVGALAAGPLGDIMGRRLGLVISCVVFNVGVALQTAATSLPLFIAGRVVAGIGVGLVSALVPLYQSESVPKWVRGMIVGSYQLCINVGLVLAAVVNHSTSHNNNTSSYRIPVAVQIIFGLLISGGMLFLPETPRYLTKTGERTKALKSLAFFRGLPVEHPSIAAEVSIIEASLETESNIGTGSYLSCWRPPFLKRQLTGCVLQALQQLSGINFIIYYGTQFFKTSGMHNPFLITLIINIVAFVSTFPGLYLVDRLGRRNLLLIGALGMAFCQLIVAVVGFTAFHGAGDKALICFVCFYIFCFEFSWGPCAWIVTGEIFPVRIRSKALSMTTSSNWLFNFILGFVTPYMVDSGPGNAGLHVKVFFIWTAFCFLAAVFVWCFIYETKGLSLEEVDELYGKCGKAYRSPRYRKAMELESSPERTDEEKHAQPAQGFDFTKEG